MKALKIGCFGCLLLIAFLFILYIMSSSNDSKKQTPFEVMTKKGIVKLHLGMPKDSVLMLIGEPDKYQSHSIGNTIIEDVGYKIKNNNDNDLTFTFEDGLLERFSQY